MNFDDLYKKAQEQFPEMEIKFKDESFFMKIIGKILFFNPGFMKEYLTTIGNTVYFPSKDFINNKPITSSIIFLHELTHIYNSNKRFFILSLLYLFPQLLFLLFIPILILFGWKFALIPLIFLLPIPSYFRMKEERDAYTMSIYVSNKLNKSEDIDSEAKFCISQFKNGAYYFMWPFKSIDNYFLDVVAQVKGGKKPILDNELYNKIDKILS